MKSSARLAGGLAVVVVAVSMPACSSTPAHPPLETAGSKTPAVGAGAGASPSDGGSTSDDGSVAVVEGEDSGGVAVDGGLCSSNCGGCCDNLNLCHPGGQNAACGQLGATCKVCQTGTNCNGATCQ